MLIIDEEVEVWYDGDMEKWRRIDYVKLWGERPEMRRRMQCEGVVALMALSGVDVRIEDVYKYYDEVIVMRRAEVER